MSKNYKYLQVYKGNCFNKQYIKKYNKALIFDFDETLGSFSDLHKLWIGINHFNINLQQIETNEQNNFNEILDLYPEFLRYGILNILDYLYLKKKNGHCDKIYIYTNNNCNPSWITYITNYFKYKLNFKEDLFDKIIYAFKINNKIVEISRTTRDKTYNDFINCTLLPKTTEICFIDNTFYNNMLNEKVYYIQPREYYHNISINSIIERFINSNIGTKITNNLVNEEKEGFKEFLYDWFDINNESSPKYITNIETDIFVAQKLMYHIKEFFYLTQRKNKTRKKTIRLGRITRKSSFG
jgi:hypothetical protein